MAVPVAVAVATGWFGGEPNTVTVVVAVRDPLGVAVGVAAGGHGRGAGRPRTIKYIVPATPDVGVNTSRGKIRH